jgi:DNA-binding response OmpR family regulator
MIRILIAEDNEDLRDSMNIILKNEGYNVILAENGLTAFKLALHNPPDLVISDINMPYMDGFDLIMALQKNASTSHIPFIFLSAEPVIIKKKYKQYKNIKKYVNKPFDLNDLLSAIKSIVSKKKVINEEV